MNTSSTDNAEDEMWWPYSKADVKLPWPKAVAWRVRQQHLDAPVSPGAMLEVASRLCGVQAQVMSSAELTLWARIEGLPSDAVNGALWKDRSLVKAWAMRGTLHVLPASEYATWQAAHGSFRQRTSGSWFKYFEITPAELEQLVQAIGAALEREPATRSQLAERVARTSGSAKLGELVLQSWGTMLKPAAFRGLLCFAPSAGQNVRFTRPDRWLREWHVPELGAAKRDATRRYLTAYAPSTIEDFARWFGIAAAGARRMLAGLGDAVTTVELDGRPMWVLAEHVDEIQHAEPARGSVRLLPAFDQYVIGAPRNSGAFLEPARKARVYRNQGWISPVLLVDGRMAGVWKHERKGSRLVVTVEPFAALQQRLVRKTEAEAERLASYLGGRLELEWVTPSGS
jgi:hypothetical protein